MKAAKYLIIILLLSLAFLIIPEIPPANATGGIDGHAICTTTGSSCAVSLTTTLSNDLIIMQFDSGSSAVSGSCSGGGLTWTTRISNHYTLAGAANPWAFECWAIAASPLSSAALTCSAPSGNAMACLATAVSGVANTGSPFDPSGFLIGVCSAQQTTNGCQWFAGANNQGMSFGYTMTNTYNLVIGYMAMDGTAGTGGCATTGNGTPQNTIVNSQPTNTGIAGGCDTYKLVNVSGGGTFAIYVSGVPDIWGFLDAVTVTAPASTINLTCIVKEAGAPTETVTLTGGSPSPSTAPCSTGAGTTTAITVTPSCTLTVTVATDGANTRYRFNASATSATTQNITCPAAAGSSSVTIWNYYELQNTYAMNPNTPSTWDAAYSKAITGTVTGVGSATGCTVSLANGGGSANCAAWFDYNTAVSFVASFAATGGSGGTWTGVAPTTFTDTTGGNTRTVNYNLIISQTITCTMIPGSAPQATLTMTGASISPGTLLCDGAAHSFTWATGGTITATEPADGSNTRDRFNVANSPSTTISTSASTAWSFNNYYEVQNTYRYVPTNPVTWDATYTKNPSGTIVGVAAQNICAATLSNGGGAATCTGWADSNTAVTLASFASSVSGTWTAQAPNSFTDTTGGNTRSVNFVLSGAPTQFCVYYVLIGGGVFNAPIFHYIQGGIGKTLTLTLVSQCITPDAQTVWTINNPLTGPSASAVERAFTQNSTTGTVTTPSNLHWIYYHQFGPQFRYVVVSGTPTPGDRPDMAYVQFGAAVTNVDQSLTYVTIWMDASTNWSVENPWFDNLQTFNANPAAGIALDGNQHTIYYSLAPACSSTDPFQELLKGCLVGTFYYTYAQVFGNFGMAAIDIMIAVAIYLKNENPMSAILFILVSGGVLATFLPGFFLQFGSILLVIGMAGGIFQIIRER